jgi:hypothetical protein
LQDPVHHPEGVDREQDRGDAEQDGRLAAVAALGGVVRPAAVKITAKAKSAAAIASWMIWAVVIGAPRRPSEGWGRSKIRVVGGDGCQPSLA